MSRPIMPNAEEDEASQYLRWTSDLGASAQSHFAAPLINGHFQPFADPSTVAPPNSDVEYPTYSYSAGASTNIQFVTPPINQFEGQADPWGNINAPGLYTYGDYTDSTGSLFPDFEFNNGHQFHSQAEALSSSQDIRASGSMAPSAIYSPNPATFEPRTFAVPQSCFGRKDHLFLNMEITTIREVGTDMHSVHADIDDFRQKLQRAAERNCKLFVESESTYPAQHWSHSPNSTEVRTFNRSQLKWQKKQLERIVKVFKDNRTNLGTQRVDVQMKSEAEARKLRNDYFDSFEDSSLQIIIHRASVRELPRGIYFRPLEYVQISGKEPRLPLGE